MSLAKNNFVGSISSPSIDVAEVEKFSNLSDKWWDEEGEFKPLHMLNPLRIEYIKQRIDCPHKQELANQELANKGAGYGKKHGEEGDSHNNDSHNGYSGLKILDIGCGGGLLAEPFARLGFDVTAIDASLQNIKIAKSHAISQGLIKGDSLKNSPVKKNQSPKEDKVLKSPILGLSEEITLPKLEYLHTSAEELAEERPEYYDIILNMEVIEHVADVTSFVESSCRMLKNGGVIFFATINRTIKSFLFAILGAEYILRLLPKGTHSWQKFLKPGQIEEILSQNNIHLQEITGIKYSPFSENFCLCKDVGVNYIMHGVKKPQ